MRTAVLVRERRCPYRSPVKSGDIALPGPAFVTSGRVVPLLVLLYLLAKRFIFLVALLGIVPLLLKDGGGLVSLMALVNRGAADGSQRRKDRKQYLGIDRFQHHVSKSRKIGLPGITLVRRAHVIGRALLLNKGSGVQVLRCSVPAFH